MGVLYPYKHTVNTRQRKKTKNRKIEKRSASYLRFKRLNGILVPMTVTT